MKKVILFLTMLLFFNSYSFARKTRSDKGGHHKTGYHYTPSVLKKKPTENESLKNNHLTNHKSTSGANSISTSTNSVDSKSTSSIPIVVDRSVYIKRQLMIGGGFVLFVLLIVLIVKAFKKKEPIKEVKVPHVDCVNEDGKKVLKFLEEAYKENKAIKISDIPGLDGLEDFSKIDEKFEITVQRTQLYFNSLIEFLNDRWIAENEELVGISEKEALEKYSINLLKNEILYKQFEDCVFYELKRNRSMPVYSGLSYRIPLGSGFNYRIGTCSNLNPDARDEWSVQSTGSVFLTNKRIIFLGTSNKIINLNSLLDIEKFNDSVLLGKTTGKKPLIKFDFDDSSVFSRLLVRLF